MKRLFRALLLLVAVSLMVHFLTRGPWLFPFESAQLDSWLLLKQPRKPEHIILVIIDESDYADLFMAASPLDSSQVKRILDAILAGQPRVVGFDIDTAAQSFKGLTIPIPPPSVVWAEDALSGNSEDGSLEPLGALGGKRSGILSGLALFPQDADGVVRRYLSCFETTRGRMPSFPIAVLEAARGRRVECSHRSRAAEVILNFAGDRLAFHRLRASDVIEGAKGSAWTNQGPLRDKIVLVGGAYRAARDEYITPLGPMTGVELAAAALESESLGGGIRPINKGIFLAFELLVGVVVILLHVYFQTSRAVLFSLTAIVVGTFLSSWVAFATLAYWINGIPVLVAVLLHQLYEQCRPAVGGAPRGIGKHASFRVPDKVEPRGSQRMLGRKPPLIWMAFALIAVWVVLSRRRPDSEVTSPPSRIAP